MTRQLLIVDDNEQERTIFATYFQSVGASVLEAENGEAGLRMAMEHAPSLILLDLSMPVLDGWETLRLLKAEVRTHWIPVLALTAHHLEWERLKEAGFCGYLEKPIVPFRVLEEVEACLGPLHGNAAPWEHEPGHGILGRARWNR
jgi:CheY-like chemotaxis protein